MTLTPPHAFIILEHNTQHLSYLTLTSFDEAKVFTSNTYGCPQNFNLLGVNTVYKARKQNC